VVNAQQVKMVPDRKTDVRDSEWLAQLSSARTSPAACGQRFRSRPLA
jgi:hypothetical protein